MHKLHCELRDLPGALERSLRVIRVRGFQLQQLEVEQHQGSLMLNLQLSGERSIEQLVAQLTKLEDNVKVSNDLFWCLNERKLRHRL